MRRTATLICAVVSVLFVSACAKTVSTSSFKGEQHEVAQTIANLQSDATAADQKKLCTNDLATAVVGSGSLGLRGPKSCEQAIKDQLAEIDSLEVTVLSIQVNAASKTATAKVRSIYDGKGRLGTLTLAKEAGKWKVTKLQ